MIILKKMDIIQQIITKITQVSSILIVVSGNNGDSLASGLALRAFIKKLEKDVVLLTPDTINSKFRFLPGIEETVKEIDLTKSFVVDLSTKKTDLAELSYRKEADKIAIYLKPKQGEYTRDDVTFRSSTFPYELIIMIGISSLEQLGNFYAHNTSLFFETPIVNIDYRVNNENYGQFNLVQLSYTSNSEIVLDLINKFEASLIDENIATQLLTGIISETNSFQHVRTTPQTFLKASQLVSLGAKQQDIISNLYKSKSLGLLKLWGRVLARIKQETELGLVYSTVSQIDIEKSSATEEDVNLIMKEMISQLAFAKILMFIREQEPNQSSVVVHSFIPLNLTNIFKDYSPVTTMPQTIRMTIPESAANTETKLVELVRHEITRINPSS